MSSGSSSQPRIASFQPRLELPDDELGRALRLWPDRPAMALLRALEARCYPPLRGFAHVLDVGCGNGKFGEILGLRDAIGLDLAIPDLERAAHSAAYASIVVGDARHMPFSADSFDTVVSNSTLEHIDEDEAVLSEVRRVLRMRGSLFLTVPSSNKESTLYFGQASAVSSEDGAREYRDWFTQYWNHRHYRTLADWRSILAAIGFELVAAQPYERFAAGFTGDLLGYVKIEYAPVPIVSDNNDVVRLFTSMMYDALVGFLMEDESAAEGEAGGLFIWARKP